MSSQFPEARPRRLRRNASLRSLFQETEFSLNDLVLPIFVEEEIDDFVAIGSWTSANVRDQAIFHADDPGGDSNAIHWFNACTHQGHAFCLGIARRNNESGPH